MQPLGNRWLHASGGLVWHWRALCHRNTLWRPFRLAVHDWLRDWQPAADQLLLVGPSAGYTLDAGFLSRWKEVVVLEPDPLARQLLRWRFDRVNWRFADIDVLSRMETANSFAEHFSRHAVLFSNVLGQMAPREAAVAGRWLGQLRAKLASHEWASYHDVISTSRAPDTPATKRAAISGESNKTLEEVLTRYWRGGELELIDHSTFTLGQHDSKTTANYCVWQILPERYHLVEWIALPAGGGADE